MSTNHDRYVTALQDEHEMVGAFIRGTITEATLRLAHTSTQTARERMDEGLPPPCACGAPGAFSLNPGEVVTHDPDGCTVGPVIVGPPA